MRVLVTGHLGYIGTVLVPRSWAPATRWSGLDTDLYRGCTFGPGRRVPSMCRPSTATCATSTPTTSTGFDAVIHLAALSNDPLGDLDPEPDVSTSTTAPRCAWRELARDAGRRAVPVLVVLQQLRRRPAAALLDESSPLRPGHAVRRVEGPRRAATSPRSHGDGFTPVSLRNATAYGVSPRLRCDIVLNNLVAWACTTGRVLLKSDGTPWRPLVHIEDIARAFLAGARGARGTSSTARRSTSARPSENYQIRDIARIVAEVVPGCEVEIAPDASPDTRNYRVDCDAVRPGRRLPAGVGHPPRGRGAVRGVHERSV